MVYVVCTKFSKDKLHWSKTTVILKSISVIKYFCFQAYFLYDFIWQYHFFNATQNFLSFFHYLSKSTSWTNIAEQTRYVLCLPKIISKKFRSENQYFSYSQSFVCNWISTINLINPLYSLNIGNVCFKPEF